MKTLILAILLTGCASAQKSPTIQSARAPQSAEERKSEEFLRNWRQEVMFHEQYGMSYEEYYEKVYKKTKLPE
jgi:hypothetical protein